MTNPLPHPLRYTLLPDGPSDRALLPILNWLIEQHLAGNLDYESYFSDAGPSPSAGLARRMLSALSQYPCDILFVHRDAESESFGRRLEEIRAAAQEVTSRWIAVIPVRMTEAWLLSDPQAIRRAADNPNGRTALGLSRRRWDRITDPKAELLAALRRASGLSEHRLKRFDAAARRARVAELTASFAHLRGLDAFRALEVEVRSALGELGALSQEGSD